MENKLKPIIENNSIVNLNSILKEISENYNEILLIDYLVEVIDFKINEQVIPKGILELEDALSSRINLIKKDIPVKNNLITESEFNRILGLLYSGAPVTKENKSDLFSYAEDAVSKMKEESISYDNQNALDIYIYYLKDKKSISSLEQNEEVVLNSYSEFITSREEIKKLKDSELKIANEKKLILERKEHSTRGAITTVVVLEVTITLGILLSVLALAKR